MLDLLTLGYRTLWNARGNIAAHEIRLKPFGPDAEAAVLDGAQLVRFLAQQLDGAQHPFLLAIEQPHVLDHVLERAAPSPLAIVVTPEWLATRAQPEAVLQRAHERGLQLIRQAPSGHALPATAGRVFQRSLHELDVQANLNVLQAAAHPASSGASDPISPDQIYAGIASRQAATHALTTRQAWALAGWPVEDVLQSYHVRALQPLRRSVEHAARLLDAELPLDRLEDCIAQDPILSLRLLTQANSAAFGLREGVGSIYRALMMIGHNALRSWLAQQLPHASTDVMLHPVMTRAALRAELMCNLMDTGIEHELRRELYLCGLFAELDLMMNEPVATILGRLPLSDRIDDALLRQTGPYFPMLETTQALTSGDLARVEGVIRGHDLAPGQVNLALLQTLAGFETL